MEGNLRQFVKKNCRCKEALADNFRKIPSIPLDFEGSVSFLSPFVRKRIRVLNLVMQSEILYERANTWNLVRY